jgi:aminoglycoside phosphotransferase (APT) family kinase protein
MTDDRRPSDTRPVRPSERLDWRALDVYLRKRLALDAAAPMEVEQFPSGHSNLTYLVRYRDRGEGARELVLRRPPLGPVPPKAHDMAREYRVLAAINPVFPLAPRPLLLCEDAAVVGATFYVMERRRGLVLRHEEPPGLAGDPEARRRVSAAVVDTLATLHAVDVTSGELAVLGRPAGFVERQVRGWTERWHRSRTDEVPEMDAIAGWLAGRLPADPARPVMVHGDYKLDNVMLDAEDPGRVVAVLDWEMSALGDALVDLGILLCYWVHAAKVLEHESVASVTLQPGWFGRDEILEHYAKRTGSDLAGIGFYEVFAIFKLTVVLQQIYYRYRKGQTDDPRFAALDGRVAQLARLATAIAEEGERNRR